ncbi:MAG: hypothetical protein QXM03_12635 [Metallosphaera sp.]|uniref:hypothetical protein n=1 Tax=Metallosphaera sp. TaxID=2020860 RepID=UPI00316464A5
MSSKPIISINVNEKSFFGWVLSQLENLPEVGEDEFINKTTKYFLDVRVRQPLNKFIFDRSGDYLVAFIDSTCDSLLCAKIVLPNMMKKLIKEIMEWEKD